MLPFFIVDGARGAHGVFYDNLALGSVDLGATLDNYHGLFRSYRAEDGDLDYYVLAGPSVPEVTRRFSWLTGGQAFTPRWSLGFAMTTMTIADAPDADARIAGFIEDCKRHRIRCDSFHFGSGYSSIGNRRYVFNWNRDKFPDPAATMARLKAAGMQPVTNIKPCLLDDHPRLAEARASGILVADGETGEPAVAQFWDGLGFHVDFTNPKGRQWWADGIRNALLDYGVTAVWSDNNEYEIWDEDAIANGDGRPYPLALARPAQALLMHKLAYETAGRADAGQTPLHHHARRRRRHRPLRPDLERRQRNRLEDAALQSDPRPEHEPVGPHQYRPRRRRFSWPLAGPGTVLPLRRILRAVAAHGDEFLEDERHRQYALDASGRAAAGARRHGSSPQPAALSLHPDVARGGGRRATGASAVVGFCFGFCRRRNRGCVHARPRSARRARAGGRGRRRAVYLPAHPGGWYDWHDGTPFEGGRTVTVAAPLGRLPLFARAGAIIPVEDENGLTAIAFGTPDHAASSLLYVDDGETADWRKVGKTIELRLRRDDGGFVLDVSGGELPALRVRGVGVSNLRVAAK